MPKALRLKEKQVIGQGSYGTIYRISQRRVVKVFHYDNYRQVDKLLEDEIVGSKKSKHCLPILDVIDVEVWDCGNLRKTRGLVKRYLPVEATEDDEDTLRHKLKGRILWDLWDRNIRKDSRGNLYIVDTQWRP